MNLVAVLGFGLQVGATPVIVERARLDPRADVSFHAIVSPDTVYVGDATLYELGVFISDEVRSRLRKNPTFVPPDLRSVLAYELPDPRGARTVVRDGRTYEVHVFRRALFPVAPGRIVVPAARLTYQMPLGSSFFSREETRELRAEPVTIVAISPPAAGRPSSWSGAVGDLRIRTVVGSAPTRVGDPFVVTLRVSGEANVKLLPRPAFALSWATVVEGAERVTVDSMSSRVRGAKEFDWLVTPTVNGSLEIPAIDYAYFDPGARRYRNAETDPLLVRVGEGALATLDSTPTSPTGRSTLPIRARWRRPLPDAPDTSLWFWVLAATVPLPGLVRLWRDRPRRAARSAPAAQLRTLAARGVADVAQVRAAIRAALSARLGAHTIPWGDAGATRRALRHCGVTDGTIDEAMVLFARVDGATYGEQTERIHDAASRALAVCEAIDREARTPAARDAKGRAWGAALSSIVLASALFAQSTPKAREFFGTGVTQYAEGNAAAAAQSFFASARNQPRAAAAWANAGTASWVASDTARAVVGWQRALRLDPLDADARVRLSLVGTDAGAGRDVVWPLPRRIPAWIAIALWLAGWFAIWRAFHRRVATLVLVAAAAIASVSRVHAQRLDDARVAVVVRPAPLRILPALGADAGPTPLTGELVQVNERSGVWVRVSAPGEREGWIDGARLMDLNARPLRE